MRTFAIGDIHGCLRALEALVESVHFSKEDRVIFLGDYVDRGPNTRETLDYLIRLESADYDLTFLKGNHEILMLDARLHGEKYLRLWTKHGGRQTLESYGLQAEIDSIPDAHWDFLESLQSYHETENHLFVHAGAAPDLSVADQTDDRLFWGRFDFPIRHQSGKTVVCGHSSQKNGCPYSVGHAICIDTFPRGERGWLTCLDVDREVCWRANQRGEVREDSLKAIANSENRWSG